MERQRRQATEVAKPTPSLRFWSGIAFGCFLMILGALISIAIVMFAYYLKHQE